LCLGSCWRGEHRAGIGPSYSVVSHPAQTYRVNTHGPTDDPVPRTVVLELNEALRVLEALEDARLALRERGAAPGLQDELATVIRVLHGKLGLDEGGVL
ncbi:MAG TPA: hypothetical protein VNB52_09510, partial [Ilumatobacteraceae bacterium]|nr:hypothetical protein [Ilumatobacteraceae bacterium]